jgi:hypothetical protein
MQSRVRVAMLRCTPTAAPPSQMVLPPMVELAAVLQLERLHTALPLVF